VDGYWLFGMFFPIKISSSMIRPIDIPDSSIFVWKLLLLYSIRMFDIIRRVIP